MMLSLNLYILIKRVHPFHMKSHCSLTKLLLILIHLFHFNFPIDIQYNTFYDESKNYEWLKLRCDERFTHAFTECGCVFKVITLFGSNQGNYFENATCLHAVNAC